MNFKDELKNNILNNINDINYIMNNLLYYYLYNRIDKSFIIDILSIYNEYNNTSYKIDILNNKILKISNDSIYKQVELL